MKSKSELRRLAHGDPEALVRRIAELEAALAWYADEDVYMERGGGFERLALVDGGALARMTVPHWESVPTALWCPDKSDDLRNK